MVNPVVKFDAGSGITTSRVEEKVQFSSSKTFWPPPNISRSTHSQGNPQFQQEIPTPKWKKQKAQDIIADLTDFQQKQKVVQQGIQHS
jgi:hypothetical protein